jgi:hypothetical protein
MPRLPEREVFLVVWVLVKGIATKRGKTAPPRGISCQKSICGAKYWVDYATPEANKCHWNGRRGLLNSIAPFNSGSIPPSPQESCWRDKSDGKAKANWKMIYEVECLDVLKTLDQGVDIRTQKSHTEPTSPVRPG